jgi:hypothetical protein
MENATTGTATKRLLLASFALVMVMFAIFAGNASAIIVSFTGRELPGKTWTCGHCIEQKALFVVSAEANTTSSVCAGGVQYNGSSWYTPYGWWCAAHDVENRFPEVTAFGAIYNPNPGAFKDYGFTAEG